MLKDFSTHYSKLVRIFAVNVEKSKEAIVLARGVFIVT